MVLYIEHHQIFSIPNGILVEHSSIPVCSGCRIHGFPFPFGLGYSIVGTTIQIVRGVVEHACVRTVGEASHGLPVKIKGGGGGGQVFEGKGVFPGLFIEFRNILQIKIVPGNPSLVVGEEGLVMCDFPSPAWVACIGGTRFHLRRVDRYLNTCSRNEIVAFGHRKELVLFINILGHIVHPTRPAAHISIYKSSLVVVLLYKTLELHLVAVQPPPDVMDVFVDGSHQYFGQILVVVKVCHLLIIKVHVESHGTVPPLRLPKHILEFFKAQ